MIGIVMDVEDIVVDKIYLKKFYKICFYVIYISVEQKDKEIS